MFSSVNTCWTLVGAFLVYFMQAGFALCEAGFTRAIFCCSSKGYHERV